MTESGISPRSLPGQPYGQFLATGVEHNEFGKVSEDPKNRVAMMDKRLRKVKGLKLDGLRYQGPAEAPGASTCCWWALARPAGPIAVARRTLEESGIAVRPRPRAGPGSVPGRRAGGADEAGQDDPGRRKQRHGAAGQADQAARRRRRYAPKPPPCAASLAATRWSGWRACSSTTAGRSCRARS